MGLGGVWATYLVPAVLKVGVLFLQRAALRRTRAAAEEERDATRAGKKKKVSLKSFVKAMITVNQTAKESSTSMARKERSQSFDNRGFDDEDRVFKAWSDAR